MVRATFAGFTTAVSALQANQKRLDITGQNLANMNTVGYTRQQLQVSSLNYTNPVSHYMNHSEVVVGFGVHMDKVTQIRDPYLDIQYRDQMHKSGYSNAMQESLDRLARFMDESQIDGIRQAFDDIQSTLNGMQNQINVGTAIYETELRTKMQSLTNLLNDASRQLDSAKLEEYTRLDGRGTNEQGALQRVNDILQQIGSLNRTIKDNQIYGQPSLELIDERNVLLDELSSYIPIEVTYYKDAEHDGVTSKGDEALWETYHLDSNGKPIMKKEWPDDLRVTTYYVEKGVRKPLVLVEGTEGKGEENHLKLDINQALSNAIRDKTKAPGEVEINFYKVDSQGAITGGSLFTMSKGNTIAGTALADKSGSIQAGLDMLWKAGSTSKDVNLQDVNGYDFYTNQLNKLAQTFADVMNQINQNYKGAGALLVNKDNNSATVANITAGNIGINKDWISGTNYLGTAGDEPAQTILDMLEAMTTTYPTKSTNLNYIKPNTTGLENNSFANYMNHLSTILANDSYSNTISLKTNVTVLNGIQNSRDSMSGVSLDEEASNMMMHMSAYNAASRLMTTLDQALDVLINNTGVVGR